MVASEWSDFSAQVRVGQAEIPVRNRHLRDGPIQSGGLEILVNPHLYIHGVI